MFWRKPILEVHVSGKKLLPPSVHLRVEQRLGHNTLMFLSVHYPMDGHKVETPKVHKENSLVTVRWGLMPDDAQMWYGFIHHGDLVSHSPQRRNNVEVNYTLVGTGQQLNTAVNKGWRKMTDSAIAQEIAKKHRLSLVAHKTKRVHEYVYQDAKTDLAFLHERAAASGRRAWVENGTVYFVDPAAWAAARKPLAPEFDVHKNGNYQHDNDGIEFFVGSDMPVGGRKAQRSATGVDHKTGRLLYNRLSDGDDTRPTLLTDTRLDSFSELDYTLDGAAITDQDWMTAIATLQGSTKLQPGQPIKLKGRAIPQRLRGDWVITAADHRLVAPITMKALKGVADFTTRVELARNAEDTYTYRSRATPRIDDNCTPGAGTWRASSMRTVIL